MPGERILPTIASAIVFAISAQLSSCRKAPSTTQEQSRKQVATPSQSSNELATESLASQVRPLEQQSPQVASEKGPVYPSTLIDITPDSSSGAPAQAKRVRVTRRPDGTELERSYLDERGQEILTVRDSEDGVVEISRSFDAAGKIVRERTTLNGVDESALRKVAQ